MVVNQPSTYVRRNFLMGTIKNLDKVLGLPSNLRRFECPGYYNQTIELNLPLLMKNPIQFCRPNPDCCNEND